MEPLLAQADVHARALCLAVMRDKVHEDNDIVVPGDFSCESVRCAAAAPLAAVSSDEALPDEALHDEAMQIVVDVGVDMYGGLSFV